MADNPEPGAELIIKHVEERFKSHHARVIRHLELAAAIDIVEELPDGVADGELHNNKLLVAKRVAAARPGGAIQMVDVSEPVIARDNIELQVPPAVRMPALPTPQQAGPSGLNAHAPQFRRRVD